MTVKIDYDTTTCDEREDDAAITMTLTIPTWSTMTTTTITKVNTTTFPLGNQ